MWVWNGWGWRFISLTGQWTTTTTTWTPDPRPSTIHEMPVAVDEYVARIREKCD